jgi:hypothetical protein
MYRTLAISLLLLSSTNAWAYLDPGTGSMIIQGIIAGIAMAGFTIKTYWYKIRSFFDKSAESSLLEEESASVEEEPRQ